MPGGCTSLAIELSCSHKITPDPSMQQGVMSESRAYNFFFFNPLHVHRTLQAIQVVRMQQVCYIVLCIALSWVRVHQNNELLLSDVNVHMSLESFSL